MTDSAAAAPTGDRAIIDAINQWPKFTTLRFAAPSPHTLHCQIASGKLNTMTKKFWREFEQAFAIVSVRIDIVRVVVISGNGRLFTAGLDLNDHVDLFTDSDGDRDVSRVALQRLSMVEAYQRSFSVLESMPQTVITLVNGHCVGGGIDLITAADIRLACSDAVFSIKEIDIGMCADVGTLQRIERIIGNSSLVREWALTGRSFSAGEALAAGLISPTIFASYSEGLKSALALASTIASKSPIALIGTKRFLNYARDHRASDGLQSIAVWNSVMLQSGDVKDAIKASLAKQQPIFAKL